MLHKLIWFYQLQQQMFCRSFNLDIFTYDFDIFTYDSDMLKLYIELKNEIKFDISQVPETDKMEHFL